MDNETLVIDNETLAIDDETLAIDDEILANVTKLLPRIYIRFISNSKKVNKNELPLSDSILLADKDSYVLKTADGYYLVVS